MTLCFRDSARNHSDKNDDPLILLISVAQTEAQNPHSFGVPSLRVRLQTSTYIFTLTESRCCQERATLLQLGDEEGKKQNSSSYSYLLSLGKGKMLSNIFQRGKNKIPMGHYHTQNNIP